MRLDRLPRTSFEKDFASHVIKFEIHSKNPESLKCQDHYLCFRIIFGDSY